MDNFINYQHVLSSKNCQAFLLGDYNINILQKNDNVENFLSSSLAQGFLPVIDKATRLDNYNNSFSCIDNIFKNGDNENCSSGIITSDISDHFTIFHILKNKTKKKKHKFSYYRNMNEENIELFVEQLSNIDWQQVIEENSTQIAFDKFLSILASKFNDSFPKKKRRPNKKTCKLQPFMTRGLLKSRLKKLKLLGKKQKTPTEANINEYNTYRNIYNRLIKEAKKHYYNSSLEEHKGDMKKTWEVLKEAISKQNNRSDKISELCFNGEVIKDKWKMANKLNNFFVSIADDIVSNINPPLPQNIDPTTHMTHVDSHMTFKNVDPESLKTIVSEMDNKKSSDLFDMSNFLIKKIINVILNPLCHIFNLSLSTGVIPVQLKEAKIVPIYKLDNGNDAGKKIPANYRPISLLPIISKILEKIVGQQLSDYLELNHIIYKHQYGFQQNKSTVHPMIHLLNEIGRAKKDGKVSVGIFMDISRAFDSLSIPILIKKLEKIGIKNTELDWFKNYLSGRKQCIFLNDIKSSFLETNRGVPQGGVISPILFLIYINDLPNITEMLTLLFADDSNFIYSGNSLDEILPLINADLKKICDWFRLNELSIHPDKSKFMIFNKNESSIDWDNISINLNFNNDGSNDENLIKKLGYINSESTIPAVKFLGVFIDSKLNFEYHIKYIRKKIAFSLFAINRAKKYLNEKALKTLYISLIHSNLTYCLIIWSSCKLSTLNPLIKLQKKAIRIISNANYNAHTEKLFKKHEILPLNELAIYSKILFMYDFINNRLPSSFENMWIRNAELNQNRRSQRFNNGNKFHVPMCAKSIEKLPIFYFQKLWNERCENDLLNSEIRKNMFKKTLKTLLFIDVQTVCTKPNCVECS